MTGPKLPTTLEKAETALLEHRAIDHAREMVRAFRRWDGTLPFAPGLEKTWDSGRPFSWFRRADNQRWAKHWLKHMATDPHWVAYLCQLARAGWDIADDALREVIVEQQERGEEMLASLRGYNAEIIQGLSRHGRWDKSQIFLRDMAVIVIVLQLCEMFALPPTRSRASRREGVSGCRIAAAALAAEGEALSEAAVVKIWTRYGHAAIPERGWPGRRQAPI